jgi:N-acyl-L-homoserine lactone synthetase
MERRLARHGNPRLKLGEVREADEDTIVAEIVTLDGSLVQKLAIERRSGVLRQLDD